MLAYVRANYLLYKAFWLLPIMLLISLTAFKPCERQAIEYQGIPLYYWQQKAFVNFGDYLSLLLVEKIVGTPVKVHQNYPKNNVKKLLAIGSILSFAKDNDLIWGCGINGKLPNKSDYSFSCLDVRAVRGPLTRQFLWAFPN